MKTSICLLLISALQYANVFAQNLQLSESTNLCFRGKIGFEHWHFPRKAPTSAMNNYLARPSGQLDLTLQFKAPFEVRCNQRIELGFNNANQNKWQVEDLYFDYFQSWFEARGGYQTFSWKTVESVSQADFLNQIDLEYDLFKPRKLSELSLRLRFIPASDVEQVIEIYYMPRFRPARIPGNKNRFSFGLNIDNNEASHLYQSPGKQWRPQIAASYQRPLFEQLLDARFFYFNGYNKFPGFTPLNPNNPLNGFAHYYHLIHKSGFTFQGEMNVLLVKGEAVLTAYQKNVSNQRGQTIKPRYMAYTLGFEHTYYNAFVDNQDVGLIFELIGDTDAGKSADELEGFRPFQSHLFGGLRYAFNNIGDRSVLLGGFLNYREGDMIFSLEYSERLAETFTIYLSYRDLFVNTPPLDQFFHTDRFMLELQYHF